MSTAAQGARPLATRVARRLVHGSSRPVLDAARLAAIAEADRAVRDRAMHERRPAGDVVAAGRLLAAMDAGTTPDPDDVSHAVRAFAAAADEALARADLPGAAAALARATDVAFHRTLHLDAHPASGTGSLLVDSPDLLLDPLRASVSWRLATRRGPGRTPAADSTRRPRRDRPHRLLLVTVRNWKFLEPVAQVYEGRDDVEVRRLDLADLRLLPLSSVQQLRLRIAGPPDVRATRWARPLVRATDWADTVLVDWLQRGAVLATALTRRPGTRLVARLHSFEVLTPFPHLVDYDRVDDLAVVGPHLGRVLDTLVPAAAQDAGGPRRHVLPNVAGLGRFDRPKDDDARFTLAVLGYGVVAKDPMWAVETLAVLRREDPRYRLLLVGDDFDPAGPAGAADYGRALDARITAPDVAGAVEKVSFTRDVPGLLRRVGVIVSSSVRESFHLALVEGAASRAVPVVRDWPLFAVAGGPAGLFPTAWVVRTPAGAAERVLALTGDATTWRAAGARAAEWVLDRYDTRATMPQYDALLLRRAVGSA